MLRTSHARTTSPPRTRANLVSARDALTTTAGPKLRAAIGPGWQGTIVWVDGIRVKLIDWCQCYRGEPQEKLLDLYYDVYARTGTAVIIRW